MEIELIGIIVLFIIFIIAGYFMFKNNKKQGATTIQQFVGKKRGDLCSSNEMCASNKCLNNVCY